MNSIEIINENNAHADNNVAADSSHPLTQQAQQMLSMILQTSSLAHTQAKHFLSYAHISIRTIPCAISKAAKLVWAALVRLVNYLFQRTLYVDENRLLTGSYSVKPFQQDWMLNAALLKEAAAYANDAQRQELQFLATNYLAKAAPILGDEIQFLHRNAENMQQINPFTDYYYYRTALYQTLQFGKTLNEQFFAFAKTSPLIVTDTTQITHLFPLYFTNLNLANLEQEIAATFDAHVLANQDNPLQTNFKAPFLIDLTEQLSATIRTDQDLAKNRQFALVFEQLRRSLQAYFLQAAHICASRHPHFSADSIAAFLQNQTTSICCVDMQAVAGVKILPVFKQLSENNLVKEEALFIEFISFTGLLVGAMNQRRYLRDPFALRPDIRFSRKNNSIDANPYYSNIEAWLHTSLFQRMHNRFHNQEFEQQPHIKVMGKATVDLLQGLLNEIRPEKWEELNTDPIYKEVLQNSLFKIQIHLANAEAHLHNFNYFMKHIELIHSEMAIILELTRPFNSDDFNLIYRSFIEPLVPNGLSLTTGLGKTAMNIFSGLTAGILNQKPNARLVYVDDAYFEQALMLGRSNRFSELFQNSNQQPVDLYIGLFHPNVSIDPNLEEYQSRDVIADVHTLLDKGLAAEQMTVAIDTTIDELYSTKTQELLQEFTTEIAQGRLNFIFFHSGQKLDMLGMDNYYGSPFYIVNNGDVQWMPFESLACAPAHQTDALSLQWFTLALKYAADSLEQYRNLIFANTRALLDQIPANLQPNRHIEQSIKINRVNPNMAATFLDIKLLKNAHELRSYLVTINLLQGLYDADSLARIRASFGFWHSNLTAFSHREGESSTVRLNPGINPNEVPHIVNLLHTLSAKLA